MTDDLIARLADDIRPVRRGTLPRRLLAALGIGAALAFAVMVPWIGLRADLPAATGQWTFWSKFAFTLGFAVLGFVSAMRLARPGGTMRGPVAGAVALVLLLGIGGILQILAAPPEAVRELLLGGTALVCPIYIVVLSVPIHAALVLVMRRLAPTNLPLAGFATGLAAGGASAWVYAFHCGEGGLPFITIWYTLGILISALLGAAAGRWLLRWR